MLQRDAARRRPASRRSPRFDLEAFLRHASSEHRVTVVPAVPPLVRALARSPRSSTATTCRRCGSSSSCAAPCPVEARARVLASASAASSAQSFGMTEARPHRAAGGAEWCPGALGRLVPGRRGDRGRRRQRRSTGGGGDGRAVAARAGAHGRLPRRRDGDRRHDRRPGGGCTVATSRASTTTTGCTSSTASRSSSSAAATRWRRRSSRPSPRCTGRWRTPPSGRAPTRRPASGPVAYVALRAPARPRERLDWLAPAWRRTTARGGRGRRRDPAQPDRQAPAAGARGARARARRRHRGRRRLRCIGDPPLNGLTSGL